MCCRTCLGVAIILSTLLRIERSLKRRDYSQFHADVVREIATSVRDIYVPPLQTLTCFLTGIDRASVGLEEIPALSELFDEDEDRVADSIGHWLVLVLKQVQTVSDFSDEKVARGVAKVVYGCSNEIANQVLSNSALVAAIP